MRSNRVLSVFVALSLLVAAYSAFAQGLPTATITGRVLNEGRGLPGVSVSAKSPALQGTRTTVSGENGGYVLANVPPGDYTIAFALSGFQTVTKTLKAGASQQYQLDAAMSLTAIAAEATVVGKTESISQTAAGATTYTSELLAKLPTNRNITSAVLLAPGVNNNGPNGVSVAGGQSTENSYTVNGVVIEDNIRHTPNALFIEDAIQEVTTSVSGVSAEYGRFTGGVINTITKSGGNVFSGSLRSTLTNDAWQSTSAYRTATGVNPQEGTFNNKVVPTWEATFGGPILKDAIWFFGAGRYLDLSSSQTNLTRFTNIAFTGGRKESRYEGKLTISPLQSQTLTGSYIGVNSEDINYFYTPIPVSDLASIYDRQLPQTLFALNYNGVLTNSFFVDALYSKRKFTFENSGGRYTDPINGTVIRDVFNGISYNAPIFCGVCGPEKRDNDDFVAKGTYFLSTTGLGSHNIVGGYDNFGGQRLSNNYQSGSNYIMIQQSPSIVQGTNIFPVFTPNSTYVQWWPVLALSQGSDIRTVSGFLNDTWRLNNRLSFNLGVRYDKNHATDALGNLTSNDSAWSPRLAGTFDVKGDGKLRVTASYAKYVAAIQETQGGSGATLGGSPASFTWYYTGPGINTGSTGPYLSSQDALAQFFNWFQAGGCLPDPLSPGCNLPQRSAPSIGGVNLQIQGLLSSPNVQEYVLGFSGNIGNRGTFRADIVRRNYTDFYDLKKDMTTGKVTSPVNASLQYDLGLIVNSNDYRREYTGLHTQFAYRFSDRLSLGGNWSWSHLIGDIVGETSGSGPVQGGSHAYPEYFDRKWNNPVGDLSSDERHRVRVYGSYDLPIPASAGGLSLGLIESWDTGQPYGAVGSVATRAYVTNPGYILSQTPASVNYYFTSRDAFRTDDIWRTDLSLVYTMRIANTVEVFINPAVVNVFNSQHISGVNTGVATAVSTPSGFNAFNPFTTANPIECPQGQTAAQCKAMGANWQKGPLFGQPTGPTSATLAGSYQQPRTFQVSVGLRF